MDKEIKRIIVYMSCMILFIAVIFFIDHNTKMGAIHFIKPEVWDLDIHLGNGANFLSRFGCTFGDNVYVTNWKIDGYVKNPYGKSFEDLRLTYTMWNLNHTDEFGMMIPIIKDKVLDGKWQSSPDFSDFDLSGRQSEEFEIDLNYECKDCSEYYFIEIELCQSIDNVCYAKSERIMVIRGAFG